MVPKGLLRSQEPSTCAYPEQDKVSLHPHTCFIQIHFNMYA